jgi:hypothetical protein
MEDAMIKKEDLDALELIAKKVTAGLMDPLFAVKSAYSLGASTEVLERLKEKK